MKFGIQKWISFFLTAVLLAANAFPAHVSAKEETELEQMLKMYQEKPTDTGDLIANMNTIQEPIELTCGEVRICLNELIYDGVWMYTAVEIQPADSEKTLVMPGAADPGDPICGFNNVQIRDKRSFKEVAEEEGKQLLAVYAYPAEFDQHGEYFLDYFQLQDRSILFSGCRLNTGYTPAKISWLIQIYELDPEIGAYTRIIDDRTETQEIPAYGEIQTQTYHASAASAPALSLRKTALTTYTAFEDETEETISGIFADAQGNPIPKGLSVEAGTLQLDAFPETLYVQKEDGTLIEFKRDESFP